MSNVKTSLRILLALGVAMILAAGCASTPTHDDSSVDRFCLKVREIKSYTALDTRHVLVKARTSDYYLFTLDFACDGLAFAEGMAVEGTVNQVCDDGFGSLAYRDSSRGVRRCTILAIDPVKDADAARALIAGRAED